MMHSSPLTKLASAAEQAWQALWADLVTLSTNSVHQIVAGHQRRHSAKRGGVVRSGQRLAVVQP
jgi:hypothetical protein